MTQIRSSRPTSRSHPTAAEGSVHDLRTPVGQGYRLLWTVFTIAPIAFGADKFFGLLTDQQIRRGVHRSTQDLEASITAYIDDRNADPKPFRWTKSADDILACIERFCRRTIDVQSKCD